MVVADGPEPGSLVAQTFRVLRYFWRFVRPYQGKFYLALILLLLSVPLAQLALFLTRDVTNNALVATNLSAADRWAVVIKIVGLQVVFYFSSAILSTWREVLEWYTSMRATFDLRMFYYRHLHKLSLSALTNRSAGEHLFRATTDMVSMFRTASRPPTPTASGQSPADSKEVAMAIYSNDVDPYDPGMMGMTVRTVPLLVETLYSLGWGAALLYLISPSLSVLLILYIVPFTIVSNRMFDRVRHTAFEFKAHSERESGVLRDSIAGLRTLKSFGRLRLQRKKYGAAVISARRQGIRQISQIVVAQNIVQMLMRWTFAIGIYVYVTVRVLRGDSTVGDWIAAFLLVEAAQAPLENFVQLLQSIKMQQVPALRVMETLQAVPEIQDRPDAISMPTIVGRVEFSDVSFGYQADVPVLQGVSFTIEPGEYVGIVGPSGAGKSSLINLLLRLYQAQSGVVSIDGHDVNEVRLQSMLDQIASVPQLTYLYSGTIEANIKFGNPWVSEGALTRAVTLSGVDQFARRFNHGLQTTVGEGVTISGGEKQRIGIARALVRDPKILILDEATANLDPLTEEAILHSVDQLRTGRTVLSIAHRLKAVMGCDKIIVLEAGRVVEVGNHEELIQSGSVYRNLWDAQMRDSYEGSLEVGT